MRFHFHFGISSAKFLSHIEPFLLGVKISPSWWGLGVPFSKSDTCCWQWSWRILGGNSPWAEIAFLTPFNTVYWSCREKGLLHRTSKIKWDGREMEKRKGCVCLLAHNQRFPCQERLNPRRHFPATVMGSHLGNTQILRATATEGDPGAVESVLAEGLTQLQGDVKSLCHDSRMMGKAPSSFPILTPSTAGHRFLRAYACWQEIQTYSSQAALKP